MRTERLLVLVALLAAPAAWPCGPDFPVELLAHREASLLELGDGVFLEEAAALLPPPARALAREADPRARSYGTPDEVRLYDEGARLFHEGDEDGARARFTELLALPAAERAHRSTWAEYMLGRLSEGDEALARYARVVELARDERFGDDLGLATSAMGQAARVHLHRDELLEAVRGYAAQAAHGDGEGATSLLFVVRGVIADGREAKLLEDPLGQRLLALYLHARGDELDDAARERVWAAVLARPTMDGADRLAAARYRLGQWEEARALAARDPDARLSRWVRAKLALRDGDREEAARLLALVDEEPGCAPERVAGERAILSLAAGDELGAAEHAWRARGLHPDVYYLAERVLRLDELERFATKHDDESLRALVGRRLMRAGRYEDAQRWLPVHAREPAAAYADALKRAETDDRFDRAAALLDAAAIARERGLDILGTAHAPDWALYWGNFDLSDDEDPKTNPWISDEERARVAESAPGAGDRYHYRVVASRLAESAADLLPHRSQAFAASLCVAAKYASRDPRRVRALWSRYVREGPAVDFAPTFGQRCPAPEIDRARAMVRRPVSPWVALGLGLGLGLLGLGALGLKPIRRWRRRDRDDLPEAH